MTLLPKDLKKHDVICVEEGDDHPNGTVRLHFFEVEEVGHGCLRCFGLFTRKEAIFEIVGRPKKIRYPMWYIQKISKIPEEEVRKKVMAHQETLDMKRDQGITAAQTYRAGTRHLLQE